MSEKVVPRVRGQPCSWVVKSEGMLWEGCHCAYPVLVGEVNGDDEDPELVEGALKYPFAPPLDQRIVVCIADSRVNVEGLGGQRPKRAAVAPPRGMIGVLCKEAAFMVVEHGQICVDGFVI